MTIKYYQPGDIVIFCDTEKEHEGTYEFIGRIEANEGIPIIRLKYPGGWKELIRKEQMVPNTFKRKCTKELKIKTARRFLYQHGIKEYTQFIGFRYDEKERVEGYKQYWKKVETRFPLHEDKITKLMVNEWWGNKEYNLNIPELLGNCDLCFLKGLNATIAILTKEPWRADKWIEEEESDKNGHTFHKGITMRKIKELAMSSKKQYNLLEMDPKFNCACTA